MEKKRHKKPSGVGILTAAVLVFLTAVMAVMLQIFFVPIKNLADGKSDFPQFVQELKAA